MEIKKSPKANLENYTKLFWQLGLVLTLLTVYVGIENKTYDEGANGLALITSDHDDEEDIPEVFMEPPVEVKPPPPPPPPEKIEIIEDEEEIEETIIESTETDESEKIEIEIVEVFEEEEIIEDVPFAIIEDVPVYPGCKGTKKEKKACLNRSLQKHVVRKFNADLAGDLGLEPGKKKIYIQFKITKTGGIEIVAARAPHPRLEKEARRVVSLIPKMTPGKQRGRPVNVTYMLPISFNVE
jgi:protein TonB|tara:strand:+ start:101728 stop:102447 length:720 start_codon:yes stop_codon:yes gene_type:complete